MKLKFFTATLTTSMVLIGCADDKTTEGIALVSKPREKAPASAAAAAPAVVTSDGVATQAITAEAIVQILNDSDNPEAAIDQLYDQPELAFALIMKQDSALSDYFYSLSDRLELNDLEKFLDYQADPSHDGLTYGEIKRYFYNARDEADEVITNITTQITCLSTGEGCATAANGNVFMARRTEIIELLGIDPTCNIQEQINEKAEALQAELAAYSSSAGMSSLGSTELAEIKQNSETIFANADKRIALLNELVVLEQAVPAVDELVALKNQWMDYHAFVVTQVDAVTAYAQSRLAAAQAVATTVTEGTEEIKKVSSAKAASCAHVTVIECATTFPRSTEEDQPNDI